MDLKIFGDQYKKSIADAIKIGALDSKTDSLLRDMFKVLSNEIKRKEDAVKRTMGEIAQLQQTHQLVLSLVNNHTRIEQQSLDAEADRQRLLNETEEEKKVKLEPSDANKKLNKRAKKTTKKVQKTGTAGKFSGDRS